MVSVFGCAAEGAGVALSAVAAVDGASVALVASIAAGVARLPVVSPCADSGG